MTMINRVAVMLLAASFAVVHGFNRPVRRPMAQSVSPVLQPMSTINNSGRPAFSPRCAKVDEKKEEEILATWDPSQWTAPALHNSPAFRALALVSAMGLAWFYSTNAANPLAGVSSQAAATVHLLSYGTWFGSVIYTTFIGGITMFQNLPRQTFGKLQSKLFPKYFNLGAVTIALQLLTLNKLPAMMTKKVLVALGTSFAMTLLNLAYLEPKSTRIMFERYELDDVPGGRTSDRYRQLAASFGKFHGMSSLANLIALCGGVAHSFYLASALVA